MSQYSSINLEYLVQQQQEQIVALQILIAQVGPEERDVAVVLQPITGLNIEVAKL